MLDKLFASRATQAPAPSRAGMLWRVTSTAGVPVTDETALTYSAVWSAVKCISETIAILPWHLFEYADGGREIMRRDPLDALLHRAPNLEQTAFAFREHLVASALLHGNGYAEIERSEIGAPVAMHAIQSPLVSLARDDAGRLYYSVQRTGGSSDRIDAGDMLHLRGPTRDGLVGHSMISLACDAWGLGLAAEKFAGAFFANGGVPSLVLKQGESSPDLSPEATKNMLESFERRHGGAGKAGKTAYLERGFDIESVGIPQKDAQFIESRKFAITDVARWFRLPPHKIGDLERATFSNVESQERAFVNDAILPWVVRLEQEAWVKLLRDDRLSTKLDVRALLRGDSKDRAEYYTKMRDLGALSINDILRLEDMNPIDGGELRLVPLNMISVDKASRSGGTDPTSAMRAVLLDAHDRLATKEKHAYQRAREGSKDLVAWSLDFYSRHEAQLVEALTPGALAFARLVGVEDDVVSGVVVAHAHALVERSMSLATSGVVRDFPRSDADADRLLGRILGVCHAH